MQAGPPGQRVARRGMTSRGWGSSDRVGTARRGAMNKLRILVADDHPLLCTALCTLLQAQPDMQVAGEATDGLAAVECAAKLQPELVVMDLSMPKLGGIEATRRIKLACPATKVVALTGSHDPEQLRLALAAGATGYVLKCAAADEVLRAIRAAAQGGLYLDPTIAADAVARAGEGRPGETLLSSREAEVLRMIAQGYALKEIAAKLDLSTRTLETYRVRAMEKKNLRSRADIVDYALQQGWLVPR